MQETTLTEMRIELGMSVEVLADALGVSTRELERWERDEASCPYQKMLELAMDAIAAKEYINSDESQRAMAAVDAALERSAAREAEEAEESKRHDAWWAEHNEWLKSQGMEPVQWKPPAA
jgi:transcriptional regulator with XRE-family HTH domain